MIRVTFADQESRDQFAERFNLLSKVDTLLLDIPWNLLQFAKLEDKAVDYDDLESNQEHEFIVKGDPEKFKHIADVQEDLGKGFYLVKTTEGTLLGDFVDSIEHNNHGMKLMGNVSDLTQLNGTATELDPLSADGQWHRNRIVSRYRPLHTSFDIHNLTYQTKPEVYVIDSGINFNHEEFNYPGFEYENFYTCFPGQFDDDVGHGTAVASMVAGKNVGISNHAKICNIKIGNAQGTTSLLEVGKALDALMARASADPLKTRIANMSWGVARSAWLDERIEGLMAVGVTIVCAAGNYGTSVEDISPAGIIDVITVASSDKYDIPSGFNDISPSDAGVTTGHGLSLDLFAPGENIMVATGKGGYVISSGTSWASPIVAGVAATIASLRESFTPYDQLKGYVLSTATKDALLFEDDRFSENQNNLVYLFTSDTNSIYKTQQLSMYLGVHDEQGSPIIASMKTAVDTAAWIKVLPDDPITWSIKFNDTEVENTYKQYFSINDVTGVLTINKPETTLPESVKLKMVDFVIIATNGKISGESGNCFFFDANPLYKTSLDTDITLALTETNSISYFHQWGLFLK